MNVPIDTLAFTQRFESAGFAQDQARALATAFAETADAVRADLVTKADLDLRLFELEARLNQRFAASDMRMSEMEVRLTRQIAEVGKDLSGRLWSTVTIIAGVATAISATVGAAVALLLKAGGL
jgi:hypothetical protein